ncbi:MAG: M23 family metallopeptidase [Clostridia bacterium]|nr:M23 family metallopeptidase [Clostridia bacterium]
MKKTATVFLCAVACVCTGCIWFVGGQAGAYAWNIAVCILAPAAIITLLVQVPVFMIALHKKKNVLWNIAFTVVLLLIALPITVLIGVSPVTYPTHANPNDAVAMTLPVEDAVLFGGKGYKTHAMWPSECYAYDILKNPYDIGSENLDDYGIFSCDIAAPISGTVIGLENKEPDIIPNTDAFSSALGNYIFIEIDTTGTYLILAHLQQDSISVKIGDHVKQGQVIGKVGNSGTTSEPHLHIQHQRDNPLETAFPICAEGLPILFEK